MADEQENVRIVIEVVDKFSKPLVDLKNQLQVISGQGEGPKKVASNFEGLRLSIHGVARSITGILMPSLRVLGLGFAGVAASLAAAVASLKSFATSTAELSRLSRETGLTIDKMRELEAAGRRVGISAGEMRSSYRAFSEEMDKMRVGVSTAATEMRQRGLGFVVEGLKARAGDVNKQLEYGLSIMDRISNPRHKREFAEMLKLPANIASLTGKEREEAIKKYRETVGKLDKETEAASKRFEESINKLSDSFEKFVNELAKTGTIDKLGTGLSKLADNIDPIVAKLGVAVDKLSAIADTLSNSWLFKAPPPTVSWGEWWEHQKGGSGPGKKMSFVTGGGGGSETINILKQGVSEGVQDAFKKMMFGDNADNVGGGGGAANVVRASLGGGRGGGGAGGGGATESIPSGGGGAMPKGQSAANAQVIYDTLRGLGHTHEQASAALAHAEAESNFNPTLPGDRGTSLGIWQWRDARDTKRRSAMIKFARERGLDWRDPKTQAMFFDWDLRHGEGKHAGPAYFGAESTRDAVTALNNYERFKGWQQGQARRYGYGEKYRRSMKPSEGQTQSGVPMPRPRPSMGEYREASYSPGNQFEAPGARNRWLGGMIDYPDRRRDLGAAAVPRERMMEATASGAMGKVEGEASVRIELAGFPRGTKTSASSSGIFSEVELHRGNTVPLASESA